MARRQRAAVTAAALLLVGCLRLPAGSTADPSPAPVRASPTPFPTSPAASPSPTPACRQAGTWIDFQYAGAAVAGDVPARIYLPPCYDNNLQRYPVAYFLHGKPYTEAQWTQLGLPELVDDSVGSGALPPMILVLARQPEPLFSNSDGGEGSYETEFIEGLVAAVDRGFRTETEAEDRAVVGISRGGVWALEIALRHPDQIGAVAALSPALAVNYARQAYDPLHLAAAAPALPKRFLLAAGASDWARQATEDLAETIGLRGASPELVVVPGDHSDPTWERLMPAVIDFLARALAPS